ncbi:MAG: 30S ribosomal protein S3 [Bacillales bacterium]|nr:30S ribosomal protein S3 [Bacillales bacterium]MDY6003487.1 30S ribosomal protein S3 [Bacilli bacterium]
MGQKVSPIGMRIGINKQWNSRWFANDSDFATYLHEDIKIRKYLKYELDGKPSDKGNENSRALVSHIEIERRKADKKSANVLIKLFVARPGVVLGEQGSNIERITKVVSGMLKGSRVKIAVIEVKNPDLDATLVAESIAKELENRVSFRVAQKKAIQRVRKAGAKGVRTMISGRLGGADIARSEGYKEGIVPLTTLRSDIDYAHAEAVTAYGRLGVKVWICRGEVLDTKEEKDNAKKGE